MPKNVTLTAVDAYGRQIQALRPYSASRTLYIGAGAQTLTATFTFSTVVRMSGTGNCHVKIGSAPTATPEPKAGRIAAALNSPSVITA